MTYEEKQLANLGYRYICAMRNADAALSACDSNKETNDLLKEFADELCETANELGSEYRKAVKQYEEKYGKRYIHNYGCACERAG